MSARKTEPGTGDVPQQDMSDMVAYIGTDDPSCLGGMSEADLNRLWAERYAYSSHDVNNSVAITTEREINRNTWELSLVKLGYPNVQFDTSRHSMTVTRHLLTDLRVYLTQNSEMRARQAISIEHSAAVDGKVLQVTLDLRGLHMEYHTSTGCKVSVHWSAPATYAIEQDPLSADRFRQHFEPLKKMELTTLSAPFALALHNVKTYIDYSDRYLSFSIDASIRYSRVRKEAPLLPATEDFSAVMVCSVSTFPMIEYRLLPMDAHWITGLFAPNRSLRLKHGACDAGGQLCLLLYAFANPGSALAQAQPATQGHDLTLTPLVTFADAGGNPVELELLSSVEGTTWRGQGPLRGTLRPQSGKCHYTPPAAPSPAVRFSQAGDTLIRAAYRDSLSTPTVTDVVEASAGGGVAYTSIVVRWVHPTHFIRVAKHSTRELKLSLCYLNRSYQERVVPDSQVSWHVVAGNGSIISGIFKTAESDPSAYSVVIGIDESNQDEWRWGMTIIALPMLDIDTLVDAYSR